jgi:hypothetical protein
MLFYLRGLLPVRIGSFYEKYDFRNFYQFFNWRRLSASSIEEPFRLHIHHLHIFSKILSHYTALQLRNKFRHPEKRFKNASKRSLCYGIRFQYDVMVRHANYSYGLRAAWLRLLGLNDAAWQSSKCFCLVCK